MFGKAWHGARPAQQCRPPANNSETKPSTDRHLLFSPSTVSNSRVTGRKLTKFIDQLSSPSALESPSPFQNVSATNEGAVLCALSPNRPKIGCHRNDPCKRAIVPERLKFHRLRSVTDNKSTCTTDRTNGV